METIRVPGENRKHQVLMYTISTCGWCRQARKLLKDNNIEYEYVDIDRCSKEDRQKIKSTILNLGGTLSYPAIIVDHKILVTSFQEDKIRKALGI